jgi:hypothetical protein
MFRLHRRVFLLSVVYSLATAHLNGPCKTTPESPDWPTSSTWSAFNQSIGGRLIQPRAPAAACHPDQPEYNVGSCAQIVNSWNSSQWHSDNPVSDDWQNWNNYSCLPDPSLPCSVEGYPTYVVNASTAEHIQMAVTFASDHNLRLNVKSTGHDYLGRFVQLTTL